ncbi:MAG: binding-protein-dependent transport system inner rane component [Paenibacillaceae bacterium]|jgi:putative aldouronate transport system permease protein|nr:binding-protein-dependent transport system inner rane component [Paenibacillaceae bacterium]
MKAKESIPSRIFDIVNMLFMLILIVVMLYPIIYVASASISSEAQLLSGNVTLLPKELTLNAYKKVLGDDYIWLSYWNTVRYTAAQTLITLLLTSMFAYPLSKRRLMGRRPILLFAAFTMLFSGGLIPTFLLVKNLGMLNTIWAIVIPTAISTWYMFIMRTFFEGLPEELEEAARIDGCSVFGTFLRIVLPLSKPVLMTIGLYTGVAQWNSFFDALIYLNDKALYPLQIHLRNIVIVGTDIANQGSSDGEQAPVETLKYATIMVATLPVLFVYPFIQKYFIQGSMVGSIKG